VTRRPYLDLLRGIAVVIMVEAHVVDSWTREADRQGAAYFNATFVAGLAAPLFLLLAGLALTMSAAGREERKGRAAAARAAVVRGWQVFGLAFLFRLQAQLLGWGPLVNLLKVDILNVMGLSMIITGHVWGWVHARGARVLVFAVAAAAAAMATPLVRQSTWLALLPDPIEWYLRPAPNLTTFTLFPWAGFLFAGALIGELVHAARTRAEERRLQAGLLTAAIVGSALSYLASVGPSIYAASNFWTSSPTFFFIRLGICTALVPLARITPRLPAIETLGRSSLFVYWIHVEMVYGLMATPIKRSLPLWGSLVATVLLCAVLYLLVLLKDRALSRPTPQAAASSLRKQLRNPLSPAGR
jgi:uncharacterized membrane protein